MQNTQRVGAIVNDIVREKETYISFREFAAIPRGDRYDGSTNSKRKLLDKLEVNDYYGINLVDPEDLIIGDTKDVVYILRADIPKLETHLAGFFGLYALTEKEKVERLLCTTDRPVTKAHLKEYIENKMIGRDITPSFTEFVALVLDLPDLSHLINYLAIANEVNDLYHTEMSMDEFKKWFPIFFWANITFVIPLRATEMLVTPTIPMCLIQFNVHR